MRVLGIPVCRPCGVMGSVVGCQFWPGLTSMNEKIARTEINFTNSLTISISILIIQQL